MKDILCFFFFETPTPYIDLESKEALEDMVGAEIVALAEKRGGEVEEERGKEIEGEGEWKIGEEGEERGERGEEDAVLDQLGREGEGGLTFA